MRASQEAAAAQALPQPQPLPLPLPLPPLSLLPSSPAAPPRRGRHRTSSASSSTSSTSSSSSGAGPSSSFYSYCLPSPPRASLVPFSWERHPGVPKTATSFPGGGGGGDSPAPPLPLPPPLRRPAPRHRRRRRRAHAEDVSAAAAASVSSSFSGPAAGATSCRDPFVAAFAECTRDGDADSTDHGADADVADKKIRHLARTTKPTAAASPGSGHADHQRRRRWLAAGADFVSFFDLYGCKSAAVAVVAEAAYLGRHRPVVGASRSNR